MKTTGPVQASYQKIQRENFEALYDTVFDIMLKADQLGNKNNKVTANELDASVSAHLEAHPEFKSLEVELRSAVQSHFDYALSEKRDTQRYNTLNPDWARALEARLDGLAMGLALLGPVGLGIAVVGGVLSIPGQLVTRGVLELASLGQNAMTNSLSILPDDADGNQSSDRSELGESRPLWIGSSSQTVLDPASRDERTPGDGVLSAKDPRDVITRKAEAKALVSLIALTQAAEAKGVLKPPTE